METFDDRFENEFNAWRNTLLKGTEQEMVVFKSVAYQWFKVGQRSMIDRLRDQALNNLRVLDSERERLFSNDTSATLS